jgi:hypothetical protein
MAARKSKTFWGIRTTTWFGIAKWLSLGGVGGGALITGIATAYNMIWR